MMNARLPMLLIWVPTALLATLACGNTADSHDSGATGGLVDTAVGAADGAGGTSAYDAVAGGRGGTSTPSEGGSMSPSGGGSTGEGGSSNPAGGSPPAAGGSHNPAGGAASAAGGSHNPAGGAANSEGGAVFGAGGSSAGTGGITTSGGGPSLGTGGTFAGAGGTSVTGTGGSNLGEGGQASGTGGSEPVPDAAAMALDMGFGTNIANTFENTTIWETGWGMPLVTEAYIHGMAEHGIRTVRVPVAWNTFSDNGVIPSDKMARVREVVQWIVEANMYALVNIHWDGGWIRNQGTANEYRLTDDVRQKFEGYWQQLSAAFPDIDQRLVFESMNEEGEFYVNGDKTADVPDYAPLNELNQLFVDTVRNGGGHNQTRNLLIAGFTTSIDRTCVDAFDIPEDPAGEGKLFVSIHYYEPFTFTLMAEPADWGGMVYPQTTWGTAAELAIRDEQFARMASFATQRNVAIIIGEFTAIPGEGAYVRETASRIAWLRSVIETSLSHGMVPLLFDANYDIRREDGSFSADLEAAVAGLGL